MRTARPELDVLEFKEEAPKILHAITFLYNLNDERLTKKGIIRSTILKYYKRRSSDMPVDQRPTVFVQRFIVELCSLVLIAKMLKGQNITLTGPLKLLIAGHGTLVQLLGLASMSLGGQVFDESVRACLQLVNPDPSAPPVKITGNGHGAAENDGVDDEDEGAADDATAAVARHDEGTGTVLGASRSQRRLLEDALAQGKILAAAVDTTKARYALPRSR